MQNRVRGVVNRLFGPKLGGVWIQWIQRGEGSWMNRHFAESVVVPRMDALSDKIERIAAETNALGPQPLWEGYQGNNRGGERRSGEVRTDAAMGNLYREIVTKRKPEIIVEFGTAFGVSGMYWLAGLEANRRGELFTFDPNDVWAEIARKNLSQISDRFRLTIGTFEDNIDAQLKGGQRIDLAFIDAIHTPEFVVPQLNLVAERAAPKSLIILDDINFSAEMKQCWEEIAGQKRFVASAALGERVGIVELSG